MSVKVDESLIDGNDCINNYNKARLSVFGGLMIHLALGVQYATGNIIPYISSYLAANNGGTEDRYNHYTSYASWIYAIQAGTQAFTMIFGGIIERRIGTRLTSIIGGLLIGVGMSTTYFTCDNLILTYLTLGFTVGFGIGITYTCPLLCSMRWYPHKKGFVNGIIVSGFGFSGIIFNYLSTQLMNPNGVRLDPDIGFIGEDDVLNRIPQSFIILGIIHGGLILFGSIFLTKADKFFVMAMVYDYNHQTLKDTIAYTELSSTIETQMPTTSSELIKQKKSNDITPIDDINQSNKIIERDSIKEEEPLLVPKERIKKEYKVHCGGILFNILLEYIE